MNENLDEHGFVMDHLPKDVTIDWRFWQAIQFILIKRKVQ